MFNLKKLSMLLHIAGACFACSSFAQKSSLSPDLYNAATVPDSLKENANSVVRYYNKEILVKSPGKAIIKEHVIKTILNEKDESEGQYYIFYSKKFSSVGEAEMRVYDSKGTLLKKYKKSDFYDHSAADGVSIISDSRVMALGHSIVNYPVTIEKIEEITYDSFLDLQDWDIQNKEESVEKAFCKVAFKPEAGFRYNLKNIKISPQKTREGDYEVYSWEVKGLKAIKPEEGSEDWTYLPRISFATNTINFDGYNGDMTTWNGFGLWQKQLNNEVSVLPEKRVEEIRKMVEGIVSDKDKAKFLYEYLQKNFRYVSIQLGIGGLKPFPASFVDEKKYGDCKALTNYMYTLLKAVNIPSYYAIVRAGENEEPADPKFVNDPFNHIILCIPFKGDTTWLECTSNTKEFGKLGPFTENRNALIVTEDGGKLVNTPVSNIADHLFDSESIIKINTDGTASAQLKIKSSGGYRDMLIGLSYSKVDDRKKSLLSYLNLKQPDIFELKDLKDENGFKEVELDLEYEKLSDMAAGGKYFYRPRLFDLWRLTTPVLEKRKTDYFFEHPMLKKNATTITLPSDLEVESLPTDTSFKFSYGSYSVKYTYDKEKNEVKTTAQFELNKHVIPAAKYNEMQAFMDNIAKSMSKKLVLKKKA